MENGKWKMDQDGEGASAKVSDIPTRAFDFAVRIIRLCRYLDAKPGTSRTLAAQLLRAGTSVGANVEEEQAAHSRADFIAKYLIALKGSSGNSLPSAAAFGQRLGVRQENWRVVG